MAAPTETVRPKDLATAFPLVSALTFLVVDAAAFTDPGKATLDAVLGAANVGPSGGLVFVDATYGDDDTGARADFRTPFSTPEAAQAAAASGDTVIVSPGSYALTASLGKDGVNWHLPAGVTLAVTNESANLSVFTDDGLAMTFRVTGAGTLVLAGANTDDKGPSACVSVTNAGSDVVIEAESLTTSCTSAESSPSYAAYQTAGSLTVTADVLDCQADSCWAVWWGGGSLSVAARSITAAANAAGVVTGDLTAAADGYVTADAISGANYAVSMDSTNAEGRLWVHAAAISSAAGVSQGGVVCHGGKLYVRADKVSGGTASVLDSYGAVQVTGGQLWLGAQKLTLTYGSGVFVSGGTARIDAHQIEDLGHATQAVKVTGGALELRGATAVTALGHGVTHAGGSARLSGCVLNTAAAAAANPVRLSAAGLILDRCTLVAHAGQESVVPDTSRTVVNYGSVANAVANGSATVAVEALLVDSAVA